MSELVKKGFSFFSEGFISFENSHYSNVTHLGWSEMTTSAIPQTHTRSCTSTRHKCRGRVGVRDNQRFEQTLPGSSLHGKEGYLYPVHGLFWGEEIGRMR